MRRPFRLVSSSNPILLSLFLVAMTGLAAACSGSKNSDDDDDGGDGGDSGESGSGGSSAKGGTSSSGNGGSTSGSSGSGGGGSFLADCSDVCDRASTCPDADPVACQDGCTELNTLVSSGVCAAQIEAVYECGGTTSDICGETVCETEANAFGNCLIDYCTSNTSAPICNGGG
jgi:hypothetical protein